MKKFIFSILFATLCIASISIDALEGERFKQSEEAVKLTSFGHIDAKGLKSLIDSQTSFILVDSRGNLWNDGNIIPGAILASYQDPAEVLKALFPYKNDLIVLYCYSFTCPLSDRLAHKLIDLGYTNIIEYPAGLKEWRDIAGYPIDHITR